MKVMSSRNLDAFIAEVDEKYAGNLNHPEVVARFYPMEFSAITQVNEGLDPYSNEYFECQLALYREISLRDLNQETGELHPVDISALSESANPLGITNVDFIAEHVRSITTMALLCSLGEQPEVLDMGAGHGVLSEILAFCGCRVHSVDIDPALRELAVSRASLRKLAIRRSVLNYDNVDVLEDGRYRAAFFFQSLHHALRPWQLIADLKRKLAPGGIIGFTGEPLNNRWKHWGIRLDQESLYVARRYGWFESGWSHSFIRDCFARNGFALTFFSGGHGNGEIAIASADATKVQLAEIKAPQMGLEKRYSID